MTLHLFYLILESDQAKTHFLIALSPGGPPTREREALTSMPNLCEPGSALLEAKSIDLAVETQCKAPESERAMAYHNPRNAHQRVPGSRKPRIGQRGNSVLYPAECAVYFGKTPLNAHSISRHTAKGRR